MAASNETATRLVVGTRERLAARLRPTRPSEVVPLPADELFELLGDGRRRAVVEHLASADPDETVTLAALTRRLAVDETNMDVDRIPTERRDAVRTALARRDLPALEAAGVIEWDERETEVRPGHALVAVMACIREIERRADAVAARRAANAAGCEFDGGHHFAD